MTLPSADSQSGGQSDSQLNSPVSRQVAVIGGGAAGFFGAIAAANPLCQVTLYEAGPQPLAKVRISGGGRCNVTHHCFDPAQLVQHYPRGGKALRGAFSRFQPKDTVAWFRQQGIALKTEADGRMFPVTDDSATIVDCLMATAQRVGVRIRTRSPIVSIERSGAPAAPAIPSAQPLDRGSAEAGFYLQVKGQSDDAYCDRILLATGSSPVGYRLARSLGHSIEPPVPSLFTFNVADPQLHSLSGVAIDPVRLRLSFAGLKRPLEQTGPLLITHWGLSGPAVLKLSAWGARLLHGQGYRGQLSVNWLPELSQDDLRTALEQAKAQTPKRLLTAYSPFVPLSKRLWHYLLNREQIAPDLTWANLSKKQLNRLVQALSGSLFAIAGKGSFKDEFVTCGGVRLAEVDFKTLESRRCPGLYLAGEILDIDGITGGFNFQSAWTTGWLAGQAISSTF